MGASDGANHAIVLELDPSGSGPARLRSLDMVQSGGPDPGDFGRGNDNGAALFPMRSGIVEAGNAVVFATPRGASTSNFDGLRGAFVPTGSNPASDFASAAAFRLGCP